MSTEDAWKTLAWRVRGAHYQDAHPFPWARIPSVTVHVRGGSILLTQELIEGERTTYKAYALATYKNADEFMFSVRSHEFSDDIVQLFGWRDLQVGHPDFDEKFVMKANDEAKARALFADPSVRQQLLWYRDRRWVNIKTRLVDDHGVATVLGTRYQIYWYLDTDERDVDVLESALSTLTAILSRLCDIGSIADDA